MPLVRRTWILWVAGLVALIVVAALVVPRLLPRDAVVGDPLPVQVDPTPRPGCPDRMPRDAMSMDEPQPAVTLDDDLVSLLWCPIPDMFGPTHPPTEPLTIGLDRWVSTFNGLPPAPRQLTCTAIGAPSYAYVLTHADGTTETLVGSRATCGFIAGRLGAEVIEDLTATLFRDRRADGFTPQPAPFQPCDPEQSLLSPAMEDVTQAVVCTYLPSGRVTRPLPATALPGLIAEITAGRRTQLGGHTPELPMLQLLSVNGDRLGMRFSAPTGAFVWSAEGASYEWTPSARTAAMIRDALSDEKVHPCDQAVSEPLALGHPLPADPTRAWVCGQARHAPADPLTTNLDQLVGATITPRGCAAGESLLVEYSDGRRLRLPVGPDCAEWRLEPVNAPGQSSVLAIFVRLLAAQRAAQGVVPAGQERIGKFCDGVIPSLVGVLPSAATGTRFCDFRPTDGLQYERHTEGALLTQAEHRTIVADVIAGSRPMTAADVPRDATLVPVFAFVLPSQDRLWVGRWRGMTALHWQHPETLTWYAWTPSPTTEQIFTRYATW